MDTKICSHCKLEKPKDKESFNRQTGQIDDLRPNCRKCSAAKQSEIYLKKKKKYINKALNWAAHNPKKFKEAKSKYYFKNKEKKEQIKKELKEQEDLISKPVLHETP